MRIPMTEYLEIDLDSDDGIAAAANETLGSARGNYKEGNAGLHDRDPRISTARSLILSATNSLLHPIPTGAGSWSSTVRAAER
jgi:hypothetical protein